MPTRIKTIKPATVNTTPDSRPSPARRGYGRSWQRSRAAYLADNVWCVVCLARGLYVAAEEVDHIIPHKGDAELFADPDNWQSLCAPCHSFKTATEDGGFGRASGQTEAAGRDT